MDLGLNHNTFRSRLTRGRELLRKRLVRRGVVVSVNLLGAVLLEKAQSVEVVSEVLIQSTVKTATALLALTQDKRHPRKGHENHESTK